jgi:aminoglycoside phosphotransferase (APT) family kinase protein
MTSPTVDSDAVARGLRETFPDLGDVSVVRVLGAGFNSVAVETTGTLVFRIALTAGTAERFAMETRLLPLLRERLPIAVPEPRWFAETCAAFPLGVSGYPKIEGQVLMPEMLGTGNIDGLASRTAEVLLAMRRFPVDEALALGLPGPETRPTHYEVPRAETMPALEQHLTPQEFETVRRWWEVFLSDDCMRRYEPSLCHGDFWFANMLVDAGASRLAGIVDWEHATVFDAALDVSTLLHLGEEFMARVIEAYRAAGGAFDADDAHRMRRYWQLRHLYGVLHSVRFYDDAEMVDSIRKLREGPLLGEDWG